MRYTVKKLAQLSGVSMHAELYAKLISDAKLILLKEEGHVSILINHGEEILRRVG